MANVLLHNFSDDPLFVRKYNFYRHTRKMCDVDTDQCSPCSPFVSTYLSVLVCRSFENALGKTKTLPRNITGWWCGLLSATKFDIQNVVGLLAAEICVCVCV